MAEIAVLRTQITNYSKKFLAEHEADILLHKAAKKSFDNLGVQKLPKVKDLQSEYAILLAERKKACAEYQQARQDMQDMQEALTAKANVDWLLGTEKQDPVMKK